MNFIKEIFVRAQADTPSFFKKIRKAGFSSIGIGTAIIGLPSAFASAGLTIVIPAIISTIGGYLIAGGIAVVKVSSLAVTDPTVLEKKDEQK